MRIKDRKISDRMLSGTALKLIAVLAMTVDHVGLILCADAYWMRAVGRVAFPIFAFLLVEGSCNTRNSGKYGLRLAVFAVLSEIPFDLATNGRIDGTHQNVFFTLLLGFLALWGMRRMEGSALWPIAPLAAMTAACFLRTDYDAYGVLLILLLARFRERKGGIALSIGLFCVAFSLPISLRVLLEGRFELLPLAAMECWAVSAIPLLECYNGRRGGDRLPLFLRRWAFYGYYPAHLLTLWMIRSD